MAIVSKPQYFLGTVVAIDKKDNDKLKNSREYREIIVDIPGVIQGVRAFPEMNELDEPKIGDQVLLLSLDPLYNSYFIYKKLKENDFIGFRASGKMIDITPDAITIGVFEEITDYANNEHWDGDKISGKQITSVIIDKDGNINIEAARNRGEGKLNVFIKGETDVTLDNNCTITVNGDCDINVNRSDMGSGGNCNITAQGSCTIDSPKTKLKGGVVIAGGPGMDSNPNTAANPTSTATGPWCGLPACLFTGAPHRTDTADTTTTV